MRESDKGQIVNVGQKKQQKNSDVWAFSITMWEIFTLAKEQPYNDMSVCVCVCVCVVVVVCVCVCVRSAGH